MQRAIAVALGLAVGWVVYMIAMMATVYDGLPSLIFQPILAAIASALFVGISLVAGLLLRIDPLARAWRATRWTAFLLAAGSLLLLCFGTTLGLTERVNDPETGQPLVIMNPTAALACYFLLLFSVVNWPLRNQCNTHHD